MLRHERNDHRWVFRALALVDARGVRRHKGVELAKAIGDRAPVKTGGEFAFFRLNVRHKPDVAVVDLLVIVVFDLHDLVAWREGPPEPFHLAISGGIERGLQFNIEGPCSDPASVHRAENLDVADRIETKAARDASFDQLDDARNRGLGIISLDEIEVALGFGFAKIGDDTLIDTVCVHDDLALRCLPEHFGEAHHWHGTGCR